jgi:hypothetical protein
VVSDKVGHGNCVNLRENNKSSDFASPQINHRFAAYSWQLYAIVSAFALDIENKRK